MQIEIEKINEDPIITFAWLLLEVASDGDFLNNKIAIYFISFLMWIWYEIIYSWTWILIQTSHSQIACKLHSVDTTRVQ